MCLCLFFSKKTHASPKLKDVLLPKENVDEDINIWGGLDVHVLPPTQRQVLEEAFLPDVPKILKDLHALTKARERADPSNGATTGWVGGETPLPTCKPSTRRVSTVLRTFACRPPRKKKRETTTPPPETG